MDIAVCLVFLGRLGVIRFTFLSGALRLIHIVLLLGLYFLKMLHLRRNTPSKGYEVRDRGLLRLPPHRIVSENFVLEFFWVQAVGQLLMTDLRCSLSFMKFAPPKTRKSVIIPNTYSCTLASGSAAVCLCFFFRTTSATLSPRFLGSFSKLELYQSVTCSSVNCEISSTPGIMLVMTKFSRRSISIHSWMLGIRIPVLVVRSALIAKTRRPYSS